MNTKKAAIIISGAILAAGAGGFLYWDNAYNFTGNERSIGNGGYYADFENFNGTDSFELQLEKGEKIHLDAHIDKGKADFCFFAKARTTGMLLVASRMRIPMLPQMSQAGTSLKSEPNTQRAL